MATFSPVGGRILPYATHRLHGRLHTVHQTMFPPTYRALILFIQTLALYKSFTYLLTYSTA